MFTGMVFVFEGSSLGKGQILPSSESHRDQEPHIYCVRVNARDSKFLELRGFGGSCLARYTKALLLLTELLRAGVQISSQSTPNKTAWQALPHLKW